MARYQNERWPHPEQKKERDNDIETADDNGSGLSPHGAMGGGGGGGTVIPRRRKSRPLGMPIIQRSKFHHSGHGTADKETDVERGKTKTDNGGMGCIRRPVALNIEGKLVESGLASALVYDYRNYCHGTVGGDV